MKRLFVLAAAFVLAATTAFAATLSLKGCTVDKQEAVLTVSLQDSASDVVKKDYQKAFENAASVLSFDDLAGSVGYEVFISGLSEEDAQEFADFPDGAPKLTGKSCK